MRFTRKLALLGTFAISGCRRPYVAPETPMPPNTVLLSQMMRVLSAQPGFTEAFLKDLDAGGAQQKGKKPGPALMTPRLIDELRKRILGQDWQGLDRFPGWTMREINPAVGVVSDVVAKHAATDVETRQYLDLGPYALDESETVSLGKPSTLPGFTTDGIVTALGDGVTRGDGPNELAPEHADSQRLADVLNRLAANGLDGAKPLTVAIVSTDPGTWQRSLDGRFNQSPDELIEALQQTGHTVIVDDARYFANFTHLHYNGQDVMAPFWIDSQLVIPNSGGRHLLIPASHAELEWHVRGPLVNADISYYFGIDGKSEWRTMDTLDQAWVLRRAAHTYTGAEAVEVTRLAGLLTVAYMHAHAAHPALPFGGYYALGVCQDGVSAIEHAMTGRVTLFPNTVDTAYFNDPRDTEVNALLRAIPKDRDGAAPDPERVFGSLPTVPAANGNGAFDAVTIPGLAADLNATYAAWKSGHMHKTRRPLGAIAIAVVIAMLILLLTRRRMQRD
jgi:hypothetical protein